MAFKRTTAITKLLAMWKRIRIVQGGTWAGKTYGIMAVIIDYAARNPGRMITVVAESIPALKRGAIANFTEIMSDTGRWFESRYNYSERIYTFANGSKIEFNSFETIGKVKAAGKRTDLFINESYYIDWEIADALIGRTSGNIWIDFNPVSSFWAHEELMKRPDAQFIRLIPDDNECVPESIRNEHRIKREKALTSEYWKNWCRVYLDGEIGRLMGAIFNNWRPGEFNDKLAYVANGMDFGYNDPDVLIRVSFDQKLKIIYCHQRIYSAGNTTEQLRDLMKDASVNRNELIIGDCADARMIAELKKYYNIKPVDKSKWTVSQAVRLMQDWEIVVTDESLDLITELKNYVWNDKRAGIPIDAYNHAIDCIRYVFMTYIAKPKTPQTWHG
jgi:phage terminase large subunit